MPRHRNKGQKRNNKVATKSFKNWQIQILLLLLFLLLSPWLYNPLLLYFQQPGSGL
jgi:hypothetical protein